MPYYHSITTSLSLMITLTVSYFHPHWYHSSPLLSPIITLTVTNSISISHAVLDADSGNSGVVSEDKVVGDSDFL